MNNGIEVTVSLDFESLKEEVQNNFCNRLDDLGYTKDQIDALEKSFMENIEAVFIDATFEVEMNSDETEVTGCSLIGG